MSARWIFKGFRFGMLLQFSVGPVCLYIFHTAVANGFFNAFTGVLGVALADALFIAAAILGVSKFIEKKKVQPVLKIFGAFVLFLFGLNMILGVWGHSLIPSLSVSAANRSAFLYAFLLTASSPLTILFWAGVFSSKVAEEHIPRSSLLAFGSGAVLSTLSFLTLISVLGSLATSFLSAAVIQILNLAVGILLIFFSVKMMLKKRTA